MDGLKKRLNASLQFRLSFTLSVVIVVVAGIAGVFSFFSTLDEAHELQDDVLYQIAELMDQQHLVLAPGDTATHLADGDDDSYIIIQQLASATAGHSSPHTEGVLSLPGNLAEGLHTLQSHGDTYRVLVKSQPAGGRVAIAQETDFRDKIARESAVRTLMPFLILVPILLLIITNLVRKMFQPISGLSNEIDRRSFEDLRPVPDHHLPTEVRPFVIAINRLLIRLARSRETQRRFVADAAHELRSPMTALSLQAERLDEADLPSSARERLSALRQGIQRCRNLLDQLLSLAKAQSAAEPTESPVSIPMLYRRVLEDLIPQAQAKTVDLGVTEIPDIRIQANELDLCTLIKNLVDNAIRYTPAGGRVDLSARVLDDVIELCVSDTGPGIPIQERKRVFDPFYRVLGTEQVGSGLGLAIVKTIVARLGADIDLDFSDSAAKTGLKVTIRLRQAPPA
ncbi:sensor histidine kinase [Castellaniella sp.]|uniref:sensor histidine kinase n=1 Tax=Castellaniella sp. TaxID=1955812 RepID=UPI003C715E3D